MNWEAIGAIGDLGAAIGVVISLAFVGFQILQNTKAVRAATLREALRDMASITILLADNRDLNRIYVQGLNDLNSLSIEDRQQFAVLFSTIFRYVENVLSEARDNRLKEQQWMGIKESVRWNVTQPGFKVWWYEYKAQDLFNTQVREFVENLIVGTE